jgi:2-hydroxy-6-oxonona-2,4-dienedioate hydrolase
VPTSHTIAGNSENGEVPREKPRGRVRSRRFSRADTLARALPLVEARVDGIWGERDATAYPHLDERARVLRSFQPEARFEVIPGAGHWVQYEAADRFNAVLAEIATTH